MNEMIKTPYLRPNLENQGEVPPVGELIYSPDICFAGMHPIANFQEVLKQSDSYSQNIEADAVCDVNNYIYLRCKNGSDKACSIQAQLYIVPEIQCSHPEAWTALPVDNRDEGEGNTVNVIPLMQPGEIGVAEAPFIWKRPSSHNMQAYSLIARLFSDDFPNEKPEVFLAPTPMSKLLKDGLLWAQHDISKLKFNPNEPFLCKDINLNIPTDTLFKQANWLLVIKSHKFDNWDIQIQSSRTDEEGNDIYMERRAIEPHFIVGSYVMSPGFFTRLSLFFYPRTIEIEVDEDAYLAVELYYGVPLKNAFKDSKITRSSILQAKDTDKT